MSLRIERRDRVATLTLDRPAVRNALDRELVEGLTAAFEEAGEDAGTRVIVLAAEGPVFSAGADLAGMLRMGEAEADENVRDARSLKRLLMTIDASPKPTIARIEGPAFGGAIGLIACCDIAVAAADAEFALSEVRLGLIPAVIAPFLVRAVGPRAARRLVLTGERCGATEAARLGLVHAAVPRADVDAAVARHATALLKGGPQAIASAKRLVSRVAGAIDGSLADEMARRLAEIRATPEAREGIAAFLDKRKPQWAP